MILKEQVLKFMDRHTKKVKLMITSLLLTVAPKAEHKNSNQIQMHKRVCWCNEEGFNGSLRCDIKPVGPKWCNSPLGGLHSTHNLAAVNSFITESLIA